MIRYGLRHVFLSHFLSLFCMFITAVPSLVLPRKRAYSSGSMVVNASREQPLGVANIEYARRNS